MLNRKLSEYIFYGTLALILAVIIIIRVLLLGNINEEIDLTDQANIDLQKEITALEEIVQDNKLVQTSQLYELYDEVPSVFSGITLTYKTVSILEDLGITQKNVHQRTVFVENYPTFTTDSIFLELSEKYHVVEVQVFFSTTDAQIVSDFIDEIYNDEQLFILRDLSYNVPKGESYIGVTINFLALYDVEYDVLGEN